MVYFESTRLIFRDWESGDLDSFRKMNADEHVMSYFPQTLSCDEADKFYDRIQQEFEHHGYGLFAVETKEKNEFIGFIGFHRATFEEDFTPCVEIGYRLKRPAWGKGYATEGARACLDYGFGKLGFDEVFSFTAKINHPSKAVMNKIGLHFVKEFNHPKIDLSSDLCRHVLYKIEK
ncbi:GNAT family N-acetyltransferase [Halobacillus litoralis]|uniref:GNAT family N-acetyltransferase n=1 Tax=Halobacillus litoralis TaxID=45668 RepID=UPI00248F95E5|nr:GNAT family N-acetyltransferase [Halobacillus litoralis]